MTELVQYSVILCEEVRREAHGAAILIGVTPSGPEVDDKAGTDVARIAIYVELVVDGLFNGSVDLRLIHEADTKAILESDFVVDMSSSVASDFEVELKEAQGSLVIVVNKTELHFAKSGMYRVELRLGSTGAYRTLREFVFPSAQE
ncbi:hypothetical protein [Pseudoprimorskyibacter insulae]|uniref:Uncharacterized protein n=1 Tax=Pseudoprimorskyibacter insulae TaxID=1695997 RepID=A0A2R8APX3_9RHOB|nr:hypothetical protein [Pseudoprimorskyibacter insulae]SPF78065.1 hypothetical protein PRI8871_00654 [Pseudoprimorskyibacter insulae]